MSFVEFPAGRALSLIFCCSILPSSHFGPKDTACQATPLRKLPAAGSNSPANKMVIRYPASSMPC